MADWIKGVPSPEQVRAHAEGSQEDPKIGMWLCKHDGGSYVENLYVYDLEYEAVCPHNVRGTYCFKPRENARYLPLTAEGLPTDYEAARPVMKLKKRKLYESRRVK